MKLITLAGPPSSGKTAVLTKIIKLLAEKDLKAGVIKFDCLSSSDSEYYKKHGIESITGIAGNQCPDHFFISNIPECFEWGKAKEFHYLFIESAGLCSRCSPHIKDILSICVIDNLSGINTPEKIGPMLLYADIIIITKGDIVSQAEREVFIYNIKKVNKYAKILAVNGLTGQGTGRLIKFLEDTPETKSIENHKLRFTMPAALCSYCLGETLIGSDYQTGTIKKINFN